MSNHELNCCGLACPEPVVRCQKLLSAEKATQLTVLVDNAAAQENVSRFLANRGYTIHTQQDGSAWKIIASAGDCTLVAPLLAPQPGAQKSKTLVFITTETLGQGSAELGGKLMENFLATLPEIGEELWRIILLNGGVKLAATPGNALNSLKNLENLGVDILVCGTCLNFFDLYAAKAVGQTTNMLDVVTSLALADKVIRP